MTEHERQLIAKLQGPEWDALRARVKERMEWEFSVIAKQLMSGQEIAPDIQFRRGFFAGMKFLLDEPAIQEGKLKRALDQEAVDE